MSKTVCIDYETFYSKKLKYSLRTQIAETYCLSPHFDPYLLSVYDGSESWVGSPKDFNWEALRGQNLISHNWYFEKTVTNRLKQLGVVPKDLTFKSELCTANMTAYLCNQRSLELAVEKLLGIKVDKSARSNAEDKHWPADYTQLEQKTMMEYALRDVIYAHDLYTKHGHRWPRTERRLSEITINQGMNGVQIDRELLDNYIIWSHEAKLNTEKLLPWLRDDETVDDWDDFKIAPTSTKCIAEQCRREGIPCCPVKSEDEDAYELWEATYGKTRPWIGALSAWRSINRLYKIFLVMKSRLRADGTMPFALLYFGAHTGRWAGTAKVNFQNQRKKPVFINEHGLMEMNDARTDAAMEEAEKTGKWPAWVRYTIDLRHLIIPRPGKKMIVSDLAQIEPRVLNWLVGNTKLLDMIRGGMAIYEAHARDSMGWTGGSLKKEDKMKYALAKARVLALGFGAGWEKFITMANVLAGLDITADDPEFIEIVDLAGQKKKVSGWGKRSKEIVKGFRDDNPAIVGLWKTLDEGLKRSVGEDFVMTLPNGRQMRYERVRCERRVEQDPETKLPRTRSVYTVGIGSRRVLTYGGKLCENITQAVARDVLGEQIVTMDDKGLPSLFTVHDEGIFEVDQHITAQDIEREMSQCPEWMPGCPIAAEAKEVAHYEK